MGMTKFCRVKLGDKTSTLSLDPDNWDTKLDKSNMWFSREPANCLFAREENPLGLNGACNR